MTDIQPGEYDLTYLLYDGTGRTGTERVFDGAEWLYVVRPNAPEPTP